MGYEKRIITMFFVIGVLCASQIGRAQSAWSIRIEAVEEKMDFGSPLILKMYLMLEKPYKSAYTGGISKIYRLDGLRLSVRNKDTGDDGVFIFRVPVNFQICDDKGMEYSKTEVILWDAYGEHKKLNADVVFVKPDRYSIVLTRAKKIVSNTIEVVVEPSRSGEQALSILTDANDVCFLIGGILRRPEGDTALKKVVAQAGDTTLGRWAAGRLGVTYFEEFRKKYPTLSKFRALYRTGEHEEPLFDEVCKYLNAAVELQDEFEIREQVVSNLVTGEWIKGNYERAFALLDELKSKYPGGKYGRNAQKRKEKLEELRKQDLDLIEAEKARAGDGAQRRGRGVALPVGIVLGGAGVVAVVIAGLVVLGKKRRK